MRDLNDHHNQDDVTPSDGASAGNHSSGKNYLLLGAAFALLAGSNGYLLWRVSDLSANVSKWQASTTSEISEISNTLSAGATTNHRNLESLRQDLDEARRQAATAAGKARIQAERHAEQLASKLAQEQEEQQRQVTTELTGVKETASTANAAASTANARIADVSSEVTATKSEVSGAVADLKRVTGDLGVMSGLIATNSKELSVLRGLGERNYFEFDLAKSDKPQRVGDISVQVRKADPKRNKYTVDIVADDKRVEKKDRNTNEPVQFYRAGARQPYELVVNEVRKDRLVGYLATPKTQMARK